MNNRLSLTVFDYKQINVITYHNNYIVLRYVVIFFFCYNRLPTIVIVDYNSCHILLQCLCYITLTIFYNFNMYNFYVFDYNNQSYIHILYKNVNRFLLQSLQHYIKIVIYYHIPCKLEEPIQSNIVILFK